MSLTRRRVYTAILHFPIENKRGEIITTAVTNLDVHDIARSSKTYGCRGYFIVTPGHEQHLLLDKILGHWDRPGHLDAHPDRVNALQLVRRTFDFQQVRDQIRAECDGEEPIVYMPDARDLGLPVLSYDQVRAEWQANPTGRPVVIVFGTGWGIAPEFFPEVDVILPPLKGPPDSGYNHLSVRAAAAVVLDRLLRYEENSSL